MCELNFILTLFYRKKNVLRKTVFVSHVVKRFVLYETHTHVCVYVTKQLLRGISKSILLCFCQINMSLRELSLKAQNKDSLQCFTPVLKANFA